MAENVQYQISGDGTYFDEAIKSLLYNEIPVMHSCGEKKEEEIKIKGGDSGDWIAIEDKTPAAYYATIRTTGLYYTGKYSTPVFYTLENGNYKYVEADVQYSDDRKYITVYSNTNSDLYFTFISSCKDWRSFIETKDMLYYEPIYNDNNEVVSYAVGVRREFKNVISEITSSDILSEYNKKSVTKIDEDGFSECPVLRSIAIPNTVTNIGDNAFTNCARLQGIDIPSVVESIGASAFEGCTGLATVVIPNSVKNIGWAAFYGCSGLTSVTIGNSVASIGNYAFQNCAGVTSVKIPSSVKSIGDSAFEGCTELADVTISYRITSIGASAFKSCKKIKNIKVPGSVTSIGASSFEGCIGLTSISIPFVGATKNGTSNTHFGYIFGADSYSGNKAVVPSRLKAVEVNESGHYSIASNAFYECSSIETIKLLGYPRSFGYDAFKYCTGLSGVYINNLGAWCTATFEPRFESQVPTVYSNPLYRGSDDDYSYKSRDLYIRNKKVETLHISNSETTIVRKFAFCGCTMTKLKTSVGNSEYPSDIIIEKFAFMQCPNLTEADLRLCSFGGRVYDNQLVNQSNVFVDCASLKSITINASTKEIPKGFVAADNVVGVLENVDLYRFVGAGMVASFKSSEATQRAFCCRIRTDTEMYVNIDGFLSIFTKQGSTTGGTDLFYGTWSSNSDGSGNTLRFENNNKVSYNDGEASEYVVSDGLRTSLLYGESGNGLRREIDECELNLTTIASYAFKGHAAYGVYVPSSVTTIGVASFGASPSTPYDEAYASSITINPAGGGLTIDKYGFRLFYNTTRLIIPSRVVFIDREAFFELGFGVYITHTSSSKPPQDSRCLTYIYRPYDPENPYCVGSITEIGRYAFGDPTSQREDGSYYDHWKAFQLFVLNECLSNYQNAYGWKDYVSGKRGGETYEYKLKERNSLGQIKEDVPLLSGFDPANV